MNKYNTGMLFTDYWCQTGTMSHNVWMKSFLIGNTPKLAAVMETPAMKRTNKYPFITPLIPNQLRTSVLANVVKGFDALIRSGNDNRFFTDFKKEKVTNFTEVRRYSSY